jgi:hypothetical protein
MSAIQSWIERDDAKRAEEIKTKPTRWFLYRMILGLLFLAKAAHLALTLPPVVSSDRRRCAGFPREADCRGTRSLSHPLGLLQLEEWRHLPAELTGACFRCSALFLVHMTRYPADLASIKSGVYRQSHKLAAKFGAILVRLKPAHFGARSKTHRLRQRRHRQHGARPMPPGRAAGRLDH